jgi:ABC-2 type transport system ATP-binding protein
MRAVRRAFARGVEVLRGVDLEVEPGQTVGLLGRNGAGKTTLLRIALGLLEPSQGSVRVFGLDPRERPVDVKRRVGYVSEEQVLPGFLSVADAMSIHRGLFPTWDSDLAAALVKRFSVKPDARISTLSKGQARQVAILCAVAHRPELLLLDEPAGGLDPAARREFLEVALESLGSEGASIVFSSHHMTDVERLAERVVLLHDGRKIIDCELDALRDRYSLVLCDGAIGGESSLRQAEGCVASRVHEGVLRAVFAGEPDEVRLRLGELPGLSAMRCQLVPLEELFIEIVEGQPCSAC